MLANCDLPLPVLDSDDTIYEYVVGENGDWEHWKNRVSLAYGEEVYGKDNNENEREKDRHRVKERERGRGGRWMRIC